MTGVTDRDVPQRCTTRPGMLADAGQPARLARSRGAGQAGVHVANCFSPFEAITRVADVWLEEKLAANYRVEEISAAWVGAQDDNSELL